MNIKWELRKARANAARRAAYFLKNQDQIRERILRQEASLKAEDDRRLIKWAKLSVYPEGRCKAVKGLVRQAKQGRPCLDCGGVFPPEAMDYDHRDHTTKKGDVSKMTRGGPGYVAAEIAKCDLVCSNCHRVRTARRRAGLPAVLPAPEYEI